MFAETTKVNERAQRMPLPGAATLTIEEFCASHNISVRTLWNMRRDGTAPRIMKIGRRVLISVESAREWREALTETAA
jgi:predicted DNA-binding transcriptional regulator AlpA